MLAAGYCFLTSPVCHTAIYLSISCKTFVWNLYQLQQKCVSLFLEKTLSILWVLTHSLAGTSLWCYGKAHQKKKKNHFDVVSCPCLTKSSTVCDMCATGAKQNGYFSMTIFGTISPPCFSLSLIPFTGWSTSPRQTGILLLVNEKKTTQLFWLAYTFFCLGAWLTSQKNVVLRHKLKDWTRANQKLEHNFTDPYAITILNITISCSIFGFHFWHR